MDSVRDLYIIPIEPLENRYTGHWHHFLPSQIAKNTSFNVIQIDGNELSVKTTEGAFLNFSSTVFYKADQLQHISALFHKGKVKQDSVFLVTDAWNPTAHMIRYMADLLDIRIKMVGIWHAGNYDKHDFLGRKFKDERWAQSLEASMFNLYDANIFATHFHRDLFFKAYKDSVDFLPKHVVCGFPMEYYDNLDINFKEEKEKIVVFPHRISTEKQPHVFDALAELLPEYQFIYAQKVCKNKHDYHRLLERSAVVFSANLQETLGIGVYEGMLAGCIPLVPNRLSYSEMYGKNFRYEEGDDLVEKIRDLIENRNDHMSALLLDLAMVRSVYFTGTKLYETLENI